jgi:hypothetical protein
MEIDRHCFQSLTKTLQDFSEQRKVANLLRQKKIGFFGDLKIRFFEKIGFFWGLKNPIF